MKKFKEENYQVGLFVIPGQQPRGSTHAVEVLSKRPLCKCTVSPMAKFEWTSFNVKDASCGQCKKVLEALKKTWKK